MLSLQGRLGALQERPFRLLWLGQTASGLGDAVVGIAVVFAVLDISDANGLGLVLAAYMGSRIVFIVVGGVWADRLPRRLVMLVADAVRAVVQLLVGLALLAGTAELWHFLVASVLLGVASSFFNPASTGLIPATVSPARLQQANALISLSRSTISVFGPAVSGILVAAFGPGWVFTFDALTFVASAVFLAILRVPPSPPRAVQPFLRDLAEGWSEVRSRSWVVAGLVAAAFANIAIAVYFVLGPLVAEEELGGARSWGIALTGGAIGAVVASVAGLRFRPRYPLRWAFAIWALPAVQLLVLVPPLPVLGIALAAGLSVFSVQLGNVLWNTVVQERIPEHALSRVTGYDWMVSLLFMPLGYTVAGPLAAAIGLDATLILAAALAAVGNLAVLGVRSVRAIERREPVAASASVAEAPAV